MAQMALMKSSHRQAHQPAKDTIDMNACNAISITDKAVIIRQAYQPNKDTIDMNACNAISVTDKAVIITKAITALTTPSIPSISHQGQYAYIHREHTGDILQAGAQTTRATGV